MTAQVQVSEFVEQVQEVLSKRGAPPLFVYFSCEGWGSDSYWKFVVHGGDFEVSLTAENPGQLLESAKAWLGKLERKHAA